MPPLPDWMIEDLQRPDIAKLRRTSILMEACVVQAESTWDGDPEELAKALWTCFLHSAKTLNEQIKLMKKFAAQYGPPAPSADPPVPPTP